MSGELLHLQAWGLLPLRKPLFHAASCFVFECALTPPVSPGTQATTFSLHILSSSHYQRIIQRYVTKTTMCSYISKNIWDGSHGDYHEDVPSEMWRREFWHTGTNVSEENAVTILTPPSEPLLLWRRTQYSHPKRWCPSAQLLSVPTYKNKFHHKKRSINHETGYPGVFGSVCQDSLAEFIDTSR